MAVSQQQKVDFLLKKIGYTKTKTGLADDSSLGGTKKAGFGEVHASPLIIASTSVWADSSLIPATPPGSDSPTVKRYPTSSSYRMTYDNSVSGNRAFIARSTQGNQSASVDGDWIDTQFGNDYLVKVYKGEPGTAGVTTLSAAGSGNNDGWFFDYSTGVLNFNDTNVPTGITTNNVYIVGYRYTGKKGILPPVGFGTFSSLDVSGIATFRDDVQFHGVNAGVTSAFWDKSANQFKFIDNTKLTFGDSQDLVMYHDGSDSRIVNNTGLTYLQGDVIRFRNQGDSATLLNASTSSVDLYANTDIRLSTTGYGVSVYGGSAGIGTLGAPATFHIDPGTVGDNTGLVVIKGNLQVDGTQTTVNSTTMTVDDKNIVLGQGAANDAAVDGGGITLESSGGGNKTLNWVDASKAWTSSENIHVAAGKVLGFANDTNTFIDRPAADTIKFTTGATERVRIDDSNVKITASLNVTGLSTFAANIDANGDLDVDGHTELDFVNVSAASTFAGLVDINAGGQANTFKVEDLTDNRIVIAGTGGELEDSANLTFNGTLFNVGQSTGISSFLDEDNMVSDSDTALATQQSIKKYVDDRTPQGPGGGQLTVSADSGTNQVIDLNTEVLDIEGTSNEIETVTGTNKVVIGLPNDVTIGNDLTITGDLASVTNVNVVGITTFNNNVKLLDADVLSLGTGQDLQLSHANDISLIRDTRAGVGGTLAVGADHLILRNKDGNEKYFEAVDNGKVTLFYDFLPKLETSGIGVTISSQLDTTNLKVSGVSTFTGNIDANGDIDVDGQTTLDDLNVSGVSTFAGAIDANGSLDVDGHTELDNVNVSGVSTLTDLRIGNAISIDIVRDEDDMASDDPNALATQQSIKAYVDDQVTAQDLDFVGDSGTGSVDLDSQQLDIEGTANEIVTSASGQRITIALPDNVTIGNDLTVTNDIASVANINSTGISTFGSSSGIGTVNIGAGKTALIVDGDVRVSGMMSIGSGTITLDHSQNMIKLDTATISKDSSGDVVIMKAASAGGGYNKVRASDVLIDANTVIDNSQNITATGNLSVGVAGTSIKTVVGAAVSVGIGSATPDYMLDVAGAINSETDVKIQGVSVVTQALNDAVAMAIALG